MLLELTVRNFAVIEEARLMLAKSRYLPSHLKGLRE